MGNGWADWDTPRPPRAVLTPTGVQQARYCPRCCVERIFALTGQPDDLTLACSRCRYRYGDPLTDDETLLLMDKYKLPVPLTESRLAP